MYVYNSNLIYRYTAVFNVQIVVKHSCQRYTFFAPGFIRKMKIGFFFNQVNNYAHFLKNISILNQKTIFSKPKLAKIGLSRDIKYSFRKSVNKKLFTHFFFTFLFFHDDLIPLRNIFLSKKVLNFLHWACYKNKNSVGWTF